jgi:copper chaperone CopZ
MTKKTFKITDMHCTSCALLIEADLEDAGIKGKANYAKGVVEVEINDSKIIDNNIIEIIKKSGYTAKLID